MKGSGEFTNNGQYSEPPPSYSLPLKGSNPSAPPPPPGLYPDPYIQQAPTPTVIYTNTNTITAASFGPYPIRYTCPKCNSNVLTTTYSTPGLLTYILSGALCFLGSCLCCCWVPCCIRRCKDIEHRCPECKHKLGLFKRI